MYAKFGGAGGCVIGFQGLLAASGLGYGCAVCIDCCPDKYVQSVLSCCAGAADWNTGSGVPPYPPPKKLCVVLELVLAKASCN